MKRKLSALVGIVICLSLIILSLPSNVFALSNRPPRTDANGNVIPDPNAFGDALRYGGLFGPLQGPDPFETFGMYRRGIGIYPRDMGFGTNSSRFIAINRSCSAGDCS